MDKSEKKVLTVIILVMLVSVAVITAVSFWCGYGNNTISSAKITIGEARAIALEDAGKEEASVVFTEQSREKEYGVYVYDIEFNDGLTRYEYDINAQTGEVMSRYSKVIY